MGQKKKRREYDSDAPGIDSKTMVVVVQSKKVARLVRTLTVARLIKTHDIIRTTYPKRWAEIQIQPVLQKMLMLRTALNKKYTYLTTTDVLTRPSSSPGVVIVQCAPSMTYLKGNPCHLDYINEFRDDESEPVISLFPIADFYVRVNLKDAAAIPKFEEYLKKANKDMGRTWFLMLRYGGQDHPLHVSKIIKPRPNAAVKARVRPVERYSNFVVLEGLPLATNTDKEH